MICKLSHAETHLAVTGVHSRFCATQHSVSISLVLLFAGDGMMCQFHLAMKCL